MAPNGMLRTATILATLLVGLASGTGLFWTPGNDVPLLPDMVGAGLYRRDTPFVAGAARGSDLLSLLFIPIAVYFAFFHRSARQSLVALAAVHAWWLYLGLSLAFGAVAFNELFPVYVLMPPICILGLTSALGGIADSKAPPLLAPFLLFCGLVTTGAWTLLLWDEMSSGQFPPVSFYTARATYAIDLGLIAPGCLAGAVAVWTGREKWEVLAIPLLGVAATLLPMMALQTVMQMRIGVAFGPEAAVPFVGFGVISPVAAWLLWRLARSS